MTTTHYGRPLRVEITRGQLCIRIGIETLAHATAYAEWANAWNEEDQDYKRTFAITDPLVFAKEVALALQHEKEDGSSLLSDMLDQATENAVNDGAEGCDYEDISIPTGKFSSGETWSTK